MRTLRTKTTELLKRILKPLGWFIKTPRRAFFFGATVSYISLNALCLATCQAKRPQWTVAIAELRERDKVYWKKIQEQDDAKWKARKEAAEAKRHKVEQEDN